MGNTALHSRLVGAPPEVRNQLSDPNVSDKQKETLRNLYLTEDHFYEHQLNDISFWLPILQRNKLPVPETYLVTWEGVTDNPEKNKRAITKLVSDIAYYADIVGYPFFLRTGQTSDKHSWNETCFVDSKEKIESHVKNLIDASYMADIRAGWTYKTFAVRKLLDTTPITTCFSGRMPVAIEARLFFKDGEFLKATPYWPEEALSRYGLENVKDIVEQLSTFSEEDKELFFLITSYVAPKFKGFWSLDLLKAKNEEGEDDWFIIDMAKGENSYMNPREIDMSDAIEKIKSKAGQK